MQNYGLDESQAGIKIVSRNINRLGYADDTTLMEETEEELTWWGWKRSMDKAGLKLSIQKTKIMASSPITSWHGKKWKQWQILFSWAPKSLGALTAAVKFEDDFSFETYDKPRQHIKK